MAEVFEIEGVIEIYKDSRIILFGNYNPVKILLIFNLENP